MYYVYVLKSKKDGRFFIGHTGDLHRRISSHKNGQVAATRDQIPLEVIYYEACTDKRDALKRESYLRGTYGHRYIENRLKYHLSSK